MEGSIVTTKKKNSKGLLVATIITTITLVGGLIVGILLVGQQQFFKQKAAVSGGVAKVYISPESKTVNVGETFTAKVYFDSSNTAISALTIQLEYPYTSSEPPISVTDVQVNSALAVQNNWDFPIKSITTSGGKVLVRIAGFSNSISGYTTTGQEELATISFKGNSAGTISASFNQTESKITKKADGSDTLMIPQSSGTYTVTGSGVITTPTPTATATVAPGATATPIGSIIPVPTRTPMPVPVTGATENTIIALGAGILLLAVSLIFAF
jgi:hypothetical protein